MIKLKKNDPVAKELEKYSQQVGKSLQAILVDDEHLEKVCDIFYPNLPKLVRMAMNKNKFTEFYKSHRTAFAEQLAGK